MISSHRDHYLRFDPNRVTFGLLWIFIFSIPWEEEIIFRQPIALSHVIGVGAALLGLADCLRRRFIRRPASLHYLLGAFVTWALVSYIWTIDAPLTISRAASYIQLLFMVWLMWEFAGSAQRQLDLFAAYVLGAWVSSLSTIHSFITGAGSNVGLAEGRYTAGSTNENELGIILALAIAMASHLVVQYRGYRAFWFLSVPVFFAAILLSGSRGSFLASIIALLLFPLSLLRLSPASRAVSAIALILFMAAGIAALPSATWRRVQSIPAELFHGTLTKRTYIWSAGWDAYRENPVLGVGAGAFPASVYKKLDIAYVAHNSYLSVLVELGVVGFILFAALLASLLYAALCLPATSMAAWVVLLLTWGVAVSSVSWEHRKSTWFLFGLLIAQAATLVRRRGIARKPIHAAEPAQIFTYQNRECRQ